MKLELAELIQWGLGGFVPLIPRHVSCFLVIFLDSLWLSMVIGENVGFIGCF